VETLPLEDGALAVVAELVEPGLGAAGLLAHARDVRRRTRAAWQAVVQASSIEALRE
jgi:hypothetical protein